MELVSMIRKMFFYSVLTLFVILLNGCVNSGSCDGIFQDTVKSASGKVFPALVYIKVVQSTMDSGRSSTASSSGSGVLISPDGEIVTNNHVIDKAKSIRCLLNDGRAFEAELIGCDKDTDLALLKLKLPADTPALPYAKFTCKAVEEGDFVMALGAPWGLNRSVSIGIISCANRYLAGHSLYSLWYQTDAAISPGNSGGPLINTSGEIVGINTLGMFAAGALAFTIPSSTVEIMLERFRKYHKANWAWFGFRLQVLRDFERNIYMPYSNGVVISGTEPGSPAHKAGFEVNDLLTHIDGKAVTAVTAEELPAIYRLLGLTEFGKVLEFTIRREGKTMQLKCAAAEKGKVEGDEVACRGWGFSAKAINRFDTPELHFYQPEGVFVYGVESFSPAARGGLYKGDIILQINGKAVKSLADLLEAYKQAEQTAESFRRSRMTIMRNGITLQLAIYFNKRNDEVL